MRDEVTGSSLRSHLKMPKSTSASKRSSATTSQQGGEPLAAPDEGQIALFRLEEPPNAYRKPVQVLHSAPDTAMSLVQRKILNAWLKNAAETPPDADQFWSLNISKLSRDIGFDSKNSEYLHKMAEMMMNIIFTYDVLNAPANLKQSRASKHNWEKSHLFPKVRKVGGTLQYKIDKDVMEGVLNPEVYAMIDLNIVRRFRRQASLALYEHCVRFEKVGQTTTVPWETLRSITMGKDKEAGKTFEEYKYFYAKVLKPSISEINTLSDIAVELVVYKEGRRVMNVQFLVSKRNANEDPGISDLQSMKVIGQLVAFGLPQSEAKRLAKSHTVADLSAALEFTQRRLEDTKAAPVENPLAYFRNALTRGYAKAQDVPLKTSEPTAKRAAPKQNKLMEAFLASRAKEAEAYFQELDPKDQELVVARYNEQQSVPSLRLVKGKVLKGAATQFARWLAQDTWGEPTKDKLLEFAQEMF